MLKSFKICKKEMMIMLEKIFKDSEFEFLKSVGLDDNLLDVGLSSYDLICLFYKFPHSTEKVYYIDDFITLRKILKIANIEV